MEFLAHRMLYFCPRSFDELESNLELAGTRNVALMLEQRVESAMSIKHYIIQM